MRNRELQVKRRPYIRQFYRGNRTAFAFAVLSAMFVQAQNLLISWILQQLLDAVAGAPGAESLRTLALYSAGMMLCVVAGGLISYASKPRFLEKAMRQYREYAFEQLMKKSIASFREESAADYLSALSNDAKVISENYLYRSIELLKQLVTFVGALVMMVLYSPIMTLVAVGLSLLPLAASMLAGRKLEKAEETVSDKNAGMMAAVKDILSGFSVVKSFKAEKAVFRQFAAANTAAEGAQCRRNRLATLLSLMGAAAAGSAQLGVFLVGAYLALRGYSITPGVLIVFVQLMNFIIEPIASVPGILAGRRAALALIDKLARALENNVRDEGRAIPAALETGIEIKDLSFSYDKDAPTLSGINMRFEKGKSYAIVGASGSGKSTMLNLLMAAHSDYKGDIRYDGAELRGIDASSLYDMVSLVQQDVFVFNASIRDNITMFCDFPREKTDRAIKLSGLSELIREKGEDYLCGENGAGLSGGEKQRISIARSLIRETPVLLVDEATAALDKETAFRVSDAILNLEGLTRIVVTHALDARLMARYDAILTLKAGRLIETGDFKTLMERKGYFYSLFTVSQS